MKKYSKQTAHYWLSRIYFHRQGSGHDTHYSVSIQFDKRRERFPLGTSDKREASELAREIYRTIENSGWDLALAVYKLGQSPDGHVTVGEYLGMVRKVWMGSQATLDMYCRSLRAILSEIFDLDPGNKRFDYQKAGTVTWRARVDAVDLAAIKPELVTKWVLNYGNRNKQTRGPAAEPETDKAALNRRRISANSYLRNAKSLFAPKLLARTGFKLAFVPFKEVQFFAGTDSRYFSGFDIRKLLITAKAELAPFDPDAYSVILLASVAGLRRREIDLLEWPSINFEHGIIQLQRTEYFTPKTVDSSTRIRFDAPWVLEWFKAQKLAQDRQARFVVAATVPYQLNQKSDYYRSRDLLERVARWLRDHGVDTIRPLHTLRKEAGADIVREKGLAAGAAFLRHRTITVTAAHYTDWRNMESPSFVDVGVSTEKNVVKFKKDA